MKPDGHDINGAPLYKEREYIDIRVPGKHDPIVRPARFDDRQRFPLHYKAFKDRVAQPQEGYPLSEWSGMPRSMVDMMSHYNIKTVEQLAGASDGYLANLKGVSRFKIAAIDFLERLANEGKSTQVAKELDNANKTIDAQQLQIDDLSDKVNKLISGQTLDVVADGNEAAEVKTVVANTVEDVTKAVKLETPIPVKRRRQVKK